MSDFNRIDGAELLHIDAMMAVYNAIQDGWSETEEYAIEQMPGTTDTYEIDLPATHQTIRLTVDIHPSA